MSTDSSPLTRACAASLLVTLLCAAPAAAQTPSSDGYRNARRLGGSTSFYKPPLTTPASVKRMATRAGIADDIRVVLRQHNISETAEAVLAVLSNASTAVKESSCSNLTVADGVLVECDFQPGATLDWMAYRPNIRKGIRTPGSIEKVRWSGRQPFKAFLFRVTHDYKIYTFVLPKPCGNLSLMAVQEIPRPAPPPPTPAPAPAPPPPAPAPPPPAPAPPPPAPAPPVVAPAPPPPPPAARPAFFIDALVGKDRRIRPAHAADGFPFPFGQCSPLIGLKFGVGKRFSNDIELAGAAGVAFSVVDSERKFKEHEVFIDLEVNKFLSGGSFIGTGLSLWDLTHSDTFTPAWMLHFGIPLGKTQKVHFVGEGRLFFDGIDEPKSNYNVWAGVRVHF